MKTIGIRLLVLTLLIGCSKKAENLENKIELELNHEEIMAGDFSSFAGVYVNSEGMITVSYTHLDVYKRQASARF